jgi:NAD(P)-dependent dehydrogenase (short-subunit alcohol dehydrogenase family)
MPPSHTPQENSHTSQENIVTPALAGKTALVTGASRGIGRAIAVRLAQLGAHLLLVARDPAALAEVKQEIVDLATVADVLPCDLSSTSEIAALASRIETDGGCDILINAAGIGRIGAPLHQMPIEDFDAMLATNLRAPFLLMRAVVPGMIARGGGEIVNISSLAGQGPLANGAAYSASKWALNGLSYSAAEELRAHNIRVSVVAPGSVNTSFGRGGPSSAGKTKDRSKMLQPEDVAGVVAMLVTQPPQSFISEVRMRPTQKP